MFETRHIPKALAIVALLFLLEGVSSAITMLVKLLSGRIHIDLGVLGIAAYFGLRRFSTGWRTYALICIFVGLIACPIFFFMSFFIPASLTFSLFGIQVGHMDPIWLPIITISFFFLELWQYRVLTRSDIRVLFYSLHEARTRGA